MKIEFPTIYNVNYEIGKSKYKNLKFYNPGTKKNLAIPLLAASQQYCMYCGKSLVNETDLVYHMEHSVDKAGNENQKKDEVTFLTHCKFNFSVACPTCNTVCKKNVNKVDIGDKDEHPVCEGKSCREMCNQYIEVRAIYSDSNQIILQPHGYARHNKRMRIYYDLIKNIYEPFPDGYVTEDFLFIRNHINRFRLNGERFSESIINICADLVALYDNGIYDKNELFRQISSKQFSNIMGKLFIDYLRLTFENKSSDKLIEICRLIVLLEFVD